MASLDVSPVGINVIGPETALKARWTMALATTVTATTINQEGDLATTREEGEEVNQVGEYAYHSRKDSTNGTTTPPGKQKSSLNWPRHS